MSVLGFFVRKSDSCQDTFEKEYVWLSHRGYEILVKS